jgi:DNA-binding XRE family transcriptional regulator
MAKMPRNPMVTKQASQTYDSLPDDAKGAVLALSILISRIRDLPKADREELFELLQCWRKEGDPEEQKAIRAAMEEILAQTKAGAARLVHKGTEVVADDVPSDVKKWAHHFGGKIRVLRERAGLTQAQLAEKAGLQQSHVSRLECAEYSPTHKTLTKIAAALGVTVRDLDPSAD